MPSSMDWEKLPRVLSGRWLKRHSGWLGDRCSSSALPGHVRHKSQNRSIRSVKREGQKGQTECPVTRSSFPHATHPGACLPLTHHRPSAHPPPQFQSLLYGSPPYWIQEKKLALVLAAFLVRMVELVLGPSSMLVLAGPLVPLLTPARQVALLLARLLFRMY